MFGYVLSNLTAPVPLEPMLPVPALPIPPVGFQVVRDPTTGQFFVFPTTQFGKCSRAYILQQQKALLSITLGNLSRKRMRLQNIRANLDEKFASIFTKHFVQNLLTI